MTSGPTTIEFFHDTPSGDAVAGCLVKHGNFRHLRALRKAPPPVPTQWVISSGRPDQGIAGLCFHPAKRWPSGIYDGPPLLWTRLVVLNELPVVRDTLLLRLLGAGRVLTQAITELKTMREEEPERALAMPILLRLRLAAEDKSSTQMTDDAEFLMHTHDIEEIWRLEGVKQGLEQGREQGLEQGTARSLIDLYEARFGALPDDLRALIEATHDEVALRSWIRLAGTRSADEIAAALRAFRTS